MNGSCCPSLAAVLPAGPGTTLPAPTLVEYLLIGGAGLLLVGAALISLVGFLRSRRRRHPQQRQPHGATATSASGKQRASKTAGSRRRRRREYPRRPTLAETGGLPPLRPPPSGPKDFSPY